MLATVRDTISRHAMLSPGDRVLIAASGGADSTALAYVLLQLRDEWQLDLHLFHLHHGLRGGAADRDARSVVDLAEAWGLPYTIRQVAVGAEPRHRQGLQATARRLRYAELAAVAADIGAQRVAFGHHQDDQAETLLMRLIRGTGGRGLGGIPPTRPLQVGQAVPMVIRPLLAVTRREIEGYCRRNALPYVQDESNQCETYLRTRIRYELLPLLRRYNAGVVRHLTALATVLREEDHYLDGVAATALARWTHDLAPGALMLPWELFQSEHPAVIRRVVRLVAQRLGVNLDHATVLRVLGQVDQAAGHSAGPDLHIKGRLRVSPQPQGLVIARAVMPPDPGPGVMLATPGCTPAPAFGCTVTVTVEVLAAGERPPVGSGDTVWLDPALLPGPLRLRSRRPGDRIWPQGMAGSQKVQDILVDRKVPRERRDTIPLLVAGDAVVWVVGFRVDRRFLAVGGTRAWRVRVQPVRP